MKTNAFSLLLLLMIAVGCSESTDPDPDPTPTPTPADYSSCRYTFKYSLRYSPLNSAKPTTVSYLDSTQKIKTVMLKDTSFDLAINYKYGDSAYVKFSNPYIYFASKTGNTISCTSDVITSSAAASCPKFGRIREYKASNFRIDSLAATILTVKTQLKKD